MSLNTFFDKIFIINLDRRPDRWEASSKELASHGIGPVERVAGYPHPWHGNAGCTRSHRELLRRVAEGPWQKVLVLEDDFKIITVEDLRAGGWAPDSLGMRTFESVPGQDVHERFDAMVKDVPPDWDVLYLGAGYAESPITRVSPHVIRCAGMMTTGSYGITREHAREWTRLTDEESLRIRETVTFGQSEELYPDPGVPEGTYPGAIDTVFSRYARDYHYYVFQPRLVYQRQSVSDLTGKPECYLQSMFDTYHENLV